MIRKDDRTPAQRSTHQWAVVARDTMMSNWGDATGGTSRCAWAVPILAVNLDRVWNWVRARNEMKNCNIVNLNTYHPPAGTASFHIYVVTPTHPAAKY